MRCGDEMKWDGIGMNVGREETHIVVEFREELCVEEEIGGGGQLICDGVEEDFRAVVFILLGCALL